MYFADEYCTFHDEGASNHAQEEDGDVSREESATAYGEETICEVSESHGNYEDSDEQVSGIFSFHRIA